MAMDRNGFRKAKWMVDVSSGEFAWSSSHLVAKRSASVDLCYRYIPAVGYLTGWLSVKCVGDVMGS